MNTLKAYLLLINLFLELKYFQNIETTYLNPISIMFISILLGVFYANFMLLKHGKIITNLVIVLDLFSTMYCIHYFYDDLYFPLLQTSLFIVYLLVMIPFFFTNANDYNQIKNSNFISIFILFIMNILNSYRYNYYFKTFHYRVNDNSLDYFYLGKLFFADIFILFFLLIAINVVRMYYSKQGKNKYLKRIMMLPVLLGIATIFYYINHNETIRNTIYNQVLTYLPDKVGLTLYNALPQGEENRFRLLMVLLLYSV